MSKHMRCALALFLCLLLYLSILPAAFAEEAADTAAASEAAHAVSIYFECDDPDALSRLSVYDGAGQLYSPVTDSETGKTSFGRYALAPGEYRYLFDGAGHYADLEETFTVGNTDAQFFYLALSPVYNEMTISFTYINPAYADVISEADIPEVPVDSEKSLAELKELADAISSPPRLRSARFLADSGNIYTDVSAAADDLREQIKAHETLVTIRMKVDGELTAAQFRALCEDVYSTAITHTGIPTEGDYLRYEFGGYKTLNNKVEYDAKANFTLCEFNYTPMYFTSIEQEAELTPVVNRILAGLALDGKSDYEKIQAIYGYLTDHVKYGGSGDIKFTAYGALINNRAVCQGYSNAFYRLCLESDIDARIITADSMSHAWNIVAFGGQYYEVDSTWDAGKAFEKYSYFLRGSDYWLSSHKYGGVSVLGDQFENASFASKHKLPVYDFASVQALVNYGNASLNGRIKGFDDIIAAMAAARGSSALALDEIRVLISYKSLGSISDDAEAYELYPTVTGYYQGTARRQVKIGNEQLLDGTAFSLRLPISSASWAGRSVRYTLSSSGYEDFSGISDVTLNTGTGKCTFLLSKIPRFGSVTAELLYTVTFNANNDTEPQTVTAADKTVEKPQNPVKEGFWFGGWFTDSACTARFDFKTILKADIMLYAKWVVPDLVLPAALTEIREEAFTGGSFSFVLLSEKATLIGKNAFADCPNLAYIYIPEGARIDPAAFGDRTDLTIFGKTAAGGKGSAESFAEAHGFDFIAVS